MNARRSVAVAAFYRQHRAELERRVSRRVAGPSRATVEDVCQTAWTILLRRPDVDLDERGLAWLTQVAIHEAWRAVADTDIPTGCYPFAGDGGVNAEPGPHPSPGVEQQIIARDRHQRLAEQLDQILPAERQVLRLQAIGYTYREIAEQTALTHTAVNRRLTEGRARLRRLEEPSIA